EKTELTQQNEKAKTDVHTKFDQQRHTLQDKQKNEDARLDADYNAKKEQLLRDMDQQIAAMKHHSDEQSDLIKTQGETEKKSNHDKAKEDGDKLTKDGEEQAKQDTDTGQRECDKIKADGASEAAAARSAASAAAAGVRAEGQAKAAQLRSGGGGLWDTVSGWFGGGSEGQADK